MVARELVCPGSLRREHCINKMLEMEKLRLFPLLFRTPNYREETLRITSHIGQKCLPNNAEQDLFFSYNSELLVTLLEKLTYLEYWPNSHTPSLV